MSLKEALIHEFGFSEKEIEVTMEYYSPENLKKNDFFLEEGKIAHKLGYVVSGMLRTYYINENGDDITIHFNLPGTVVTSFDSYLGRIPSLENIVALTDSELLLISHDGMQELYNRVPAWQPICQSVSEMKNQHLRERNMEFQTLTAKERYLKLLEKNPQIFRFAAMGHIASYLGVDIATLSRIRKTV